MIRKLIPAILVATLAACANTGRQDSTITSDTSSSTPSSSTYSGAGDSGGSGGSTGSSDSGGYAGSAGSSDTSASGAGYGSPFAGGPGCDAQPVQNLIGTKLTSSVENQIKQASSSTKTRVLKPGEVMTMEYDPHRINLILDQQGALTALRCG